MAEHLKDCPGCMSTLGPFIAAPDEPRQVVCSTCGMRGPYETELETAESRWNRLPRKHDGKAPSP